MKPLPANPPAGSVTATTAAAEFRFGDVVLDASRREIRVNAAVVDIQPKVFDLLHYLILHRDRVVDKTELMEALWPDVVVTEASLTQALKKARRLIGDDGDQQRIIRTVQRRGFRFIASLEAVAAGAAVPAVPQPLTSPDASVAVLAFTDMSPQQDQQHFCDGMAEEIINALARISGLRVASRTSSFAFKGSTADVREMASKLGVNSIVEGSVRRTPERLRVVAQLIDAASGFHRWSERWDRPIADVFAIQDEIAIRVAEALKQHLTSTERAAIHGARPQELSAYELYLRGQGFLNRFGRRSLRYAIEMFGQALEIDPGYAPAWAGLANSHMFLYYYAEATPEHRQRALEAGQRAVEIDPLSAEAHVALGGAAMLQEDFAGAEQAFQRAEELNPQLFEAWYFHARLCASRGDHQRAVSLYEAAASVRPDDYEALNLAIQSYTSLGRTADALHAIRRCVAATERSVAINPDDVRALCLGAGGLAELGRGEQSREWVRRAIALDPDEPHVNYNAACAFVLLGEHETALDMLERVGVESMANRTWMEHDSTLDPLRGHPRFEALLARAR